MKTKEVYSKYNTPLNLQRHMLWVTGLVKVIGDHWNLKNLDLDILIKASLVHDLGNLIKFDMIKYPPQEEEGKDLQYWIKAKEEMIRRYGEDEHGATVAMCEELEVGEKVIFIVSNKEFKSFDFVLGSDNWELKVCTYADHRIGLDGLLTLKQRFDDQIARYSLSTSGNKKAAIISERGPYLIKCAYKVEQQVQNRTAVRLDAITNDEINSYKEWLLDFEI